MTISYAMGFLALIGIPLLIIIYIIKNKYTEQTVTSTYLWTLSEKFIKRRIPINRIVGIISLILQIVAIILMSILIVHPVIILKNSANAYCYILDGSGSMNIMQDGQTRFDIGKKRIGDMIKDAANGSTYTLIYMATTTETIFEDINDKQRAIDRLNSLKPTQVSPDPAEALDEVQKYFNDNRAVINYLVTDKEYEQTRNVNVINVTEGHAVANNYALDSVGYRVENSKLKIEGKIISYTNEEKTQVTVELSVPDENGNYASVATTEVDVGVEEPADFSFTRDDITFTSLKVNITTPDDLAMDNEQIIYNISHENLGSVLLVTDDTGFFMRGALKAARCSKVDVCTTEEYASGAYTGYGLFIFDKYAPLEMPKDGSVWFINPPSTIKDANFTYQGPGIALRSAAYSESSSTTVRKLLNGVSGREFEVDGYVKCGIGGKFNTLASIDGNPILFTGANAYGNREAVFAFSLNASATFTMSADFATIVGNLLSYSFPSVVESTSFYCGDTLPINVITGCESILVKTPSGGQSYLDTSVVVSDYRLEEAGSYEIDVTLKNNGGVRVFNVFAAIPEAERLPVDTGFDFRISGLAIDGKFDGFYDNLLIIFILLALVTIADFGVYCYEQYQLR